MKGQSFHQTRPYLFLGDYKYWVMDEVEDIDPKTYDSVLNRALLYRDRRDFVGSAAFVSKSNHLGECNEKGS